MKITQKLSEDQLERIDDILDTLKSPFVWINDLYRDVKCGLKNFWFYKEVVWSDRWFDHSYLLRVLERKLQQMSQNWDKSIYVDWEEDKANIDETLRLLNLLIEDEFLENAMVLMDEEYGKLEMDLDDNSHVLFTRGKKLETSEERDDWKICHEFAADEKKTIQDKFFKLFAENYEKWWD